MFPNQRIYLLFILCIALQISAQKHELGKVTIAELEQKTYPKDSTAIAAVLFQTGDVRYELITGMGFNTITVVKTRIKIYKKEGYSNANQVITYYSGDNSSPAIKFSNAFTYNLEGGKIVKSKLENEGKFIDKVNRYWSQKKFTMPNVKEGSIIEFEYSIKQDGLGTPGKWNFQYNIPVAYSEYLTLIPEFLEFSKNQRGFVFPKMTTEKLQYHPNYQTIKTTYVAENIPAFKEEPYVNSIQNYTSSLTHELSSIKVSAFGGFYKPISKGWDAVIKSIFEMDDFDKELTKTKYFEEDINALVSNLHTNKEKVDAIYSYVKSKVKWNGETGFVCRNGVKEAYEKNIGNAAEINLMLISMLRYANVATSPVLLSTRDNGIVLFPSIRNFNHVVAVVEADNQLLFLDATDPFAMPGVLPFQDLNYQGRLMRKEGFVSYDVDLIPKTISKEVINMSAVVRTDGTIQGKIRHQLSDHKALNFRNKMTKMNRDEYLESLEKKYNAIEISEYIQDNLNDLSKPVVESHTFLSKNDMEIIDEKIYLKPQLFLTEEKNPFNLETREYPIDFGYPFEEKYNVSIEIPEGYSVTSIPNSVTYLTGDDLGVFKYMITSNENKIQIMISFGINRPIIPPDYYDVIKDFYQKSIDKQNEKIVLTKI